MKVAITGATGFVGQCLVKRFADAGHEVVALGRREPRADSASGQGVRFVQADVVNRSSLSAAFDGCDLVVHLVGIIREGRGATFDLVHVQGTANVLDEAAAAGAGRLIHMSACGTHPQAASRYHQSKWAAEEAVRSSRLSWTVFRPSLIFGRGDGFTTMLIDLVRRAPVIPIIGPGTNLFQPIAVEDVAEAFLAAAEDPSHAGKTLELGGPDRLSFETIIRLIASEMGSTKPMAHLPVWLMAAAAGVLSKIVPGFPLTPDQLTMLREDNIAEPNHAREVFGLSLTSFEDGLKGILAR